MRYFDAFAGYGGFSLGIKKAYDSISKTKGKKQRRVEDIVSINGKERLAPECIGYSEIDKFAIQTYEKHFKHKNYGDITKIDPRELPDFDLFCGGFPCQTFSIAGKRLGFDDTRGQLIFEVARILREKKPRLVLLENVKGLLSHDSGRTFKTIITTLAELGYAVEWQVLNAKDYGVPQNRERMLIVGHLGGFRGRQVFPIRATSRATSWQNTIRRGGRGSLTKKHAWDIVQINKPKHSNDRVYDPKGISPTLNTMQGGNRQPFIKLSKTVRRLTPRECERLMGMPDDWTDNVSDSQRYKLCGNGIVSNVVEEVMRKIYGFEL